LKTLKIVAISDTHTRHQQISIPKGDILIHAGDFTEKGSLNDVEKFNTFLGTLPHRHKIVIAGNHDFCFERDPQRARACLTHAIYLEDQALTLEGIHFYGSPWQPWFFNWAFNLQRGKPLQEKWEKIPENTHILITHGPPYGHCDKVQYDGRSVGCEDLLKRIELLKPRYHIFGHIHEAAGISHNTHTTFINASCLDLRYKPVNPPVVFDYTVS
jgi:Icc-related predicted phosphoesterase